jgi:hypothetical protein
MDLIAGFLTWPPFPDLKTWGFFRVFLFFAPVLRVLSCI